MKHSKVEPLAGETPSQAEERLIREHQRLVTALAGRFLSSGQEFEDLCQVGMIGLLRAIRNFQPERGLCFSTYAVPVILGEIRRYLRDDGSIKVSRTVKEHYVRLRKAEQILCQQEGESPTLSQVCAHAGLTREEALQALEGGARPISLETPVGEGGLTLADTVPGGEDPDGVDRLALNEGISRLTPRDRQIVTLRYVESRTQQQTADLLGMTQVQVSRREKKILQFLREQLSFASE